MVTTILMLSGSTRSGSTNTAVLKTAAALAPPEVSLRLYDGLKVLPQFDPDDDHDPLPAEAGRLRAALDAADAVLICTPEYAGALPGSFKNLLDWTVGGGTYRKPIAWINVSWGDRRGPPGRTPNCGPFSGTSRPTSPSRPVYTSPSAGPTSAPTASSPTTAFGNGSARPYERSRPTLSVPKPCRARAEQSAVRPRWLTAAMPLSLRGLRTVIYPAPELDTAKSWWTDVLGVEPYFDEPFYVGYNVAGYELGLLPDGPADGALTYWGVDDVAEAVRTASPRPCVPRRARCSD